MARPRWRPLLLAPVLVGALSVGAATAQEPELPRDPDLGDKLDQMLDHAKDRQMREDFQAITILQGLVAKPDKIHEKDRSQMARAIAQLFRTGRPRPPKTAHLYREAGDALAVLGEDGAKYLVKVVEDNRIKGREYAQLRADLIQALGRTKVERHVDWLLEQATRSPDDAVQAAAGQALGNFDELELRRRREVVEDLISRMGEIHMEATQLTSTDPNAPIDFGPQNARRTLDAITGPWTATLSRLTGQQFSSPPDWTHWLNKNRNWRPPE